MRTVVVTGASAGIGRAAARALARRGWNVALIARGAAGLAAAEAEVERAGGRALTMHCDVADFRAVEEAASRAERELGPIAVWVNNAMVTVFCDALSVTPEDFRRATEVTYLGAVWGTRVALARMKPRNRGAIVQVGSALSYRSIPLQSAYCGAKAALRGFTDALRCELLHDGSPRSPHHGAPCGLQYAAVRMGANLHAAAAASARHDLPARACGRGDLLGGAAPPARAVGGLARSAGHPRPALSRAAP